LDERVFSYNEVFSFLSTQQRYGKPKEENNNSEKTRVVVLSALSLSLEVVVDAANFN
jgi:hypothetical protein